MTLMDVQEDRRPNRRIDKQGRRTLRPFYVHQWLDVKDTQDVWLEAQVVNVDYSHDEKSQVEDGPTRLFVHYKGWKSRHDEWLFADPRHPHAERIALLHTHTRCPHARQQNLVLERGSHLDVLDTTDTWLAGMVCDTRPDVDQVKLTYCGWDDKYDEWINIESSRLHLSRTKTNGPPPTYKLTRAQRQLVPDRLDDTSTPTTKNNKTIEGSQHKTQHTSQHYNSTSTFEDVDQLHHYPPSSNSSSPTLPASPTPSSPLSPTHPASPVRHSRPKVVIDNSYDAKFRDDLNRTRHFDVVEQDADGNCLFRSVSHQVYGDDKFHHIVRQKCLEYIENQKYFFESFVHDEEIVHYIHRMKRSGEWGGDLEIQAMAELYDRPIEIYAYSMVPSRKYLQHLTATPIRLSYHFRSHYNSVVDPASYKQALLHPSEVGLVEDRQLKKVTWLRALRGGEFDVLTTSDRDETEMAQYRAILEQSRSHFQKVEEADMDRALEASLMEFERRMAKEVAEATSQSDLEHQEKLILEQVIQQSEGILATPTQEEQDSRDVARAIQASIEDYPPAVKECLAMSFPLELCVEAYTLLQPLQPDRKELIPAMTDYILKEMTR